MSANSHLTAVARAAALSFASLMTSAPVAGALPAGAAPPIDAAHAQKLPGTGQRVTLTDEGWQTLIPVDAFIQREPNEGGEPSQRTEFRVAYDSTTLYVRVRAFDAEPDKIVTYLTRRDDNSPGDWLRVFIDSYHDRRTAYEFAVNPSGVKQDRYWFNDTNRDDGWDAVWDVHVARDRDGWLAEFRIPFSQLRFAPGPSATFGFAVVRVDYAFPRGRRACLSPAGRQGLAPPPRRGRGGPPQSRRHISVEAMRSGGGDDRCHRRLLER